MTQRLGVTAALVDGTFVRGDVVIDAGVIRAIGSMPAGRRGVAVPGLVDVQVNGFAGVRFSACERDEYAMRDDGDGWLRRDVVSADDPDHGARHLLVRTGGGGRRDR